jgi:hypothetical protein
MRLVAVLHIELPQPQSTPDLPEQGTERDRHP